MVISARISSSNYPLGITTKITGFRDCSSFFGFVLLFVKAQSRLFQTNRELRCEKLVPKTAPNKNQVKTEKKICGKRVKNNNWEQQGRNKRRSLHKTWQQETQLHRCTATCNRTGFKHGNKLMKGTKTKDGEGVKQR